MKESGNERGVREYVRERKRERERVRGRIKGRSCEEWSELMFLLLLSCTCVESSI